MQAVTDKVTKVIEGALKKKTAELTDA